MSSSILGYISVTYKRAVLSALHKMRFIVAFRWLHKLFLLLLLFAFCFSLAIAPGGNGPLIIWPQTIGQGLARLAVELARSFGIWTFE